MTAQQEIIRSVIADFAKRPLGQITETTRLSEEEQARFRREKIGFVFQFFHLVPRLTAAENIALPLVLAGIPASERAARVAEALEATLEAAGEVLELVPVFAQRLGGEAPLRALQGCPDASGLVVRGEEDQPDAGVASPPQIGDGRFLDPPVVCERAVEIGRQDRVPHRTTRHTGGAFRSCGSTISSHSLNPPEKASSFPPRRVSGGSSSTWLTLPPPSTM